MGSHKPYQEVGVGKARYWDYNFRIKGIVYEVSVNKKTGMLAINKDPDPNCFGKDTGVDADYIEEGE